MNANLADIGAEITNSLPRDGQAAMTAAFKAFAGTLAAPGIAFGTDTGTGVRRSAGGTMRHVSSGTDIVEIGADGLTMVAGVITDVNSVTVVGIPTGVFMMYGATTAPTGWVRMNGRTIGNASSAATERANADTEDLFTFLWTNYSDSVCAVSGGRGASASADYAANKTIGLPSLRGRSPFGLDDMGNTAAGVLGTIITSSTTNGASGGAETVTLSASQIPSLSVSVSGSLTGSSDTGNFQLNGSSVGVTGGGGATVPIINTQAVPVTVSGTLTGNANASGGGNAHSNMPPAFLTTFIIKL